MINKLSALSAILYFRFQSYLIILIHKIQHLKTGPVLLNTHNVKFITILLTTNYLLLTPVYAQKSSMRADTLYATNSTSTNKGILISDTLKLLNFDATKSSGLSTDSLLTINNNGYVRKVALSRLKDSLANLNGWQVGGNSTGIADTIFGSINNTPVTIRTNNLERMRVAANGNVGIGTNLPTTMLDVNGGVRIRGTLVTATYNILTVDANGVVSALPTGNATQYLRGDKTWQPLNFDNVADAPGMGVAYNEIKRKSIVTITIPTGYRTRAAIGVQAAGGPGFSDGLFSVGNDDLGTSFVDFRFTQGGDIITPNGTVALTTSNITGSAAKLATARNIALTTDITGNANFDGSGNISIASTLANSGVIAGTYKSVTVNAKGLVTAGTNPTTLAGYGITDAVSTSGNAATATKLVTGRTISLSTDASGTSGTFDGSGNVTIPVTLATVGTAGTYRSVTVNAKGLVTAGTNPTTLAGYGITDAESKITAGTTSQYWRGDKTWQSLDLEQVADAASTAMAYNTIRRKSIVTITVPAGYRTRAAIGVQVASSGTFSDGLFSVGNDDNGTSYVDFRFTQGGTIVTPNGVVQTSDIRLKQNITPLQYGLKDILRIEPISFTWKSDSTNKVKLGVSAQQVQTVLPEVINVNNDEAKTLGVNYGDIVPVLINAIKEQQVMIEEMKKQISRLAN